MPAMRNQKSDASQSKRLFFSVVPDEATLAALLEARDSLTAARARFVPAENLHLTLAFVGKAAPEYRRCIERAAEDVGAQAFTIRLDRYGYFSKSQIFWLGPADVCPPLHSLHKQLCGKLADCGFKPPKGFKPHVTLLRKAELVTQHDGEPVIDFEVRGFHLMESIPVAGGVRYQSLREYRLHGNDSF